MKTIEKLRSIFALCRNYSVKSNISPVRLLVDSLWAKGFWGMTKEEYFYFGAGAYNALHRHQLMTPAKSRQFYRKMNAPQYVHLFLNKIDFNSTFKLFIHRRWINPVECSVDEFTQFCQTYPEVLSKPVLGVMGKNIAKYHPTSFDYEKEKNRLSKDGLFLEQCVSNISELKFGTNCLNTFRIYSFLDKDGNAHIVKTLIRVGVGNSVVDNFHAGGVVYPIDVELGIIYAQGYRFNGERVTKHPGLDVSLIGYKIPNWNELLDFVKKAALVVPQIRWVGWDVAYTTEGYEIIEGNHDADPDLLLFGNDEFVYQRLLKLM